MIVVVNGSVLVATPPGLPARLLASPLKKVPPVFGTKVLKPSV